MAERWPHRLMGCCVRHRDPAMSTKKTQLKTENLRLGGENVHAITLNDPNTKLNDPDATISGDPTHQPT
jgi:hypothetical protein